MRHNQFAASGPRGAITFLAHGEVKMKYLTIAALAAAVLASTPAYAGNGGNEPVCPKRQQGDIVYGPGNTWCIPPVGED